jgi:prephenate dehydratase
MKIAIQGEPGSFSHEAALKLVPGAEILPCALSAEVFARLDDGEADAAVIPIENSLAGSVLEHFDLLLKHDVKVVRETLLRIRHNLIAVEGASPDEIERVYSHPVALAQCRRFLAEHPQMKAIAFYDTAGSVKQLAEQQDPYAAAIASASAAAYYGAKILAVGIEDDPENYTRFFLVRRSGEVGSDPGANKMSIAFSLENRTGSLVSALTALSAMGTNLTKIESRPVHGKPWEYIFYVDCQIGSSSEAARGEAARAGAGSEVPRIGAGGDVARILDALRAHCGMVKELGRYREAQSVGRATP